tara:strand:- start:595 stop:783 length:189 start_codon:yes stop_codon:yes gene_type:complete
MYRVTIYRDDIQLDEFFDNSLSEAVGRGNKLAKKGDRVKIHSVIKSIDDHYEEEECVSDVTK